MKKILKYALIFLPFLTQAQSNLKASLDKVKIYVKEIKLEKSTVNQHFSYETATPFDVKIAITTTDSKGKSTEELYEFNLGLIGEIKRSASTKEMKVELASQKSLKVIRYTKGGEMQNYENKVELLSENIDDARELEKNLKDAITAAKTAWETSIKLPKEELGALQTWLEQNIKEATAEKQTFKQSLKKSSIYKDRASLTLEENDGKKTTETQADFSWGDLNEGSAELKISGKEIYVVAKSKNDYIKTTKGYNDEIKIYAQTPSEGSILQMAIQKIIPLAKKELQTRLPKLATKEDGFKILKDRTKDFKVNESAYTQKIATTCLTTYDLKSNNKGKTVDESFKFNFGDLSDYKLSVSKEIIKITAKVADNKKFIQYTKDGALQNYDNSVDFIVGDLEDARYLAEALPAISKGCKTNITAGDFSSLVAKLKLTENPKQDLTLQDGDKCKWKLTATLSESKKSVESVSEWNLYDIDPKKIDIDVSGKTVGITAYTLNKEKFVKLTKDSKPGFSSEINFVVKDIEDAQKSLATIKALVEGCKKP
ncbi:hypothetical protein GCM10011514_15530 [Emticicia aquatilis]|uniref:Uncharacterized protein n=1 Tax=Emticicia aquatilis TaxID=1537369 RepID=A0A917DNU8_9BACT|nr:hypothetical protein [Emticicia aquatilis]GGD52182.1 hypothetical protein GCM10011514_15530 [Emticicia aquatilis]